MSGCPTIERKVSEKERKTTATTVGRARSRGGTSLGAVEGRHKKIASKQPELAEMLSLMQKKQIQQMDLLGYSAFVRSWICTTFIDGR